MNLPDLDEIPRRNSRAWSRQEIPATPGVYFWFRDGSVVYVGEAKGKAGLRGRLGAHLATRNDLSRSTLRASVAVAQLGVDRATARSRPSVMTAEQIETVNAWLSGCELGWVECSSGAEAHELETELRAAWLPPLNLV